MRGLITDRTQANVNRCVQLSNKGWVGMTDAERAEWSGNPLTARVGGYSSPVNLIPPKGEGVSVRDGSILCESEGVIVLGATKDWAGRQLTLSCQHMTDGGELTLVVRDSASHLNRVSALTATGSAIMNIPTGNTDGTVELHVKQGYYSKVMLELYYTAHDYVPYYEILPTNAVKGAYNYSDLNRVEMAVRDISELLEMNLVTKTDWSVWDVPLRDDINRYLGNLRAIRERFSRPEMLPESLDKLTYTVANDIESFLEIAYRCADAVYRVGDVFSGEV